ncbi:MAG: hypothetical protein JWO22_1222 [Frankiales bacterium]|nr:hypothetical protein [Frankiales bacterium]
MTTTAAPLTTRSTAPTTDLPRRRTLVVLAVLYLLGFVVALGSSQDPDDVIAPEKVIAKMTRNVDTVSWITYGGIALAAVLVFYGVALRSVVRAHGRHWTTDVVGYGFAAMAGALALIAAAGLWLAKAVDVHDLGAVHTLTIIDTSTFLFAMLGLCTSMLGVGLAGRATGALPGWLCWVSIVLGAIAPIGPGGFAPFLLFPLWIIVVAATVKLPDGASA